jgi:hypothetical protein
VKFILDRLPAGLRVGTPVIVSAAAVGISAIVVAFGVGGVAKSLIQPSIDATEADPLAPLAVDSKNLLEASRKRFEGRSMYALPPMPVRKPRVVEVPKPVEPPKVDLGPPPPPATYTGPAPSSVVGNFVFFPTLSEDRKHIKLGETKAGITVMQVDGPYSVKLGYQRGEYTVSILARADDRILKGTVPTARINGITTGEAAATGAGATPAGGAAIPGATTPGATTPNAAGGAAGAATPAGGRTGLRGERVGAGVKPATPGSANGNANGNAVTDVPGDQPGGGTPAGTGPEGEPQLPSAAMEPQRLPNPGGAGQPGEDAPPPEYVDRESLPQRLSEDQIAAMTEAQARAALSAINATDRLTVDDHSRARLDHERSLLRARLDRRP